MIGDFNFPDIEWEDRRAGAKGRPFYEAASDQFLQQHVNGETHISGNTLDLILCNEEGMIDNVTKEDRIGKSDHKIIMFTVNTTDKHMNHHQQSYYKNYRKANFVEMRRRLNVVEWEKELAEKNVNDAWDSIRGLLVRLTDEHVPESRIRNRNDPKWFNNEIKRSIKEKKKAWTKYKNTKTQRDKDIYKQHEKKTKDKIKQAKNRLEREVIKAQNRIQNASTRRSTTHERRDRKSDH